jgi:diaminohydroxyphosphoribosylaminopyrimidine deaminase/5-amino-6-(5-phosphoribosylamino)uracil reductase
MERIFVDGGNDQIFMREALNEAELGAGYTSPNPAVGAVIVRDGRIIGRGHHKRCGGPHGEIEAFLSLPRESDAAGAELYVTLEPCSTTGRTPPCCDAIIRNKIRRVVIGCLDPNPKHAGRGVEILRAAGIEVKTGVLEEECRVHHEAFFRWITTGRPFVLLKMAETLDGKIAAANGDSKWVTSETARERVAYLRRLSDAVLAGAETFRIDSPRFTARTPDGTVLKTPRRIIATHHPEILSGAGEGWESAVLDTPEDWRDFLVRLGRENVTMLLIEGGGELAASAIRARAVDKIEFHIAPKLLGGRGSRPVLGGPDPAALSEAVKLDRLRVSELGCDLRIEAYPLYPEP